jgi:hypothetical protein
MSIANFVQSENIQKDRENCLKRKTYADGQQGVTGHLVRQLGKDIFLLQMMMHLKKHAKANKHVVDHTSYTSETYI